MGRCGYQHRLQLITAQDDRHLKAQKGRNGRQNLTSIRRVFRKPELFEIVFGQAFAP